MWTYQLPLMIACAAFAVVAAFLDFYQLTIATQIVVYCIALVGLDLIVSRASMMSFGHAGFMAIGAYVSAVMLQNGVPFILAAPLSVAVTALAGAALAVPASRLTGFSFALVTFAFSMVVAGLAAGGLLIAYTRGESGLSVPTGYLFGLDLYNARTMFYVSLISLAAVSALTISLIYSRTGRALRTMKESEAVAATLGIPVARMKVGIFAYSAALAGLAGVLLGQTLGAISPQTFGLHQSINLVAMLTVGGMGLALGPLVGATIFILLPEMLHGVQSNSAIVFALIFLVALIVAPRGVVGLAESIIVRLRGNRAGAAGSDPGIRIASDTPAEETGR